LAGNRPGRRTGGYRHGSRAPTHGTPTPTIDDGATVLRPVENQFYGDRTGRFEDPFGHRWSVATRIEDLSPQDMAQRAGTTPRQEFGL